MASFNIDSVIGDIFEKIYEEDVCDTFIPILLHGADAVFTKSIHCQDYLILKRYFQFNLKADIKHVPIVCISCLNCALHHLSICVAL